MLDFHRGGVCSAKFWAIAYDEAVRILNEGEVVGTVYADDSSALIRGTNYKSMIKKLQDTIDKLIKWGDKCGLSFNGEKTVVVCFGYKKDTPTSKIIINGKAIEYSNEVKYLGVDLDRKLDWKSHIDTKIKKAKSLLYNTQRLTRDTYGPKPELMKWAYQGIILPMLTYGSYVWGTRIDKYKDKLRRINRMAINTITHIKLFSRKECTYVGRYLARGVARSAMHT